MALKHEAAVLVVGAGPVGLFTALSLAARGVGVEVVDREWRGSVHSYALALHPRSLQLLDECGAAGELIRQGHRIDRMAFYVEGVRAGALDFATLGEPYPFLLVVPQNVVEQVLGQQLRRHRVRVHWNHEAQTIGEDDRGVAVQVAQLEKASLGYPIARTEWTVKHVRTVRADFLVGADGYHSVVRKAIGAGFEHQADGEAFSVFEFPSRVDYPHEGRVVFHGGTTNVLWPLDAGRARWSFEVDRNALPPPEPESLRTLVRERAAWFDADVEDVDWATAVLFERRLVDRFGRGRIWLAGDAAHITGPVGAQSMNVGLREAHELAERISALLKAGGKPEVLQGYDSERRQEWRRLLGTEGRLEPMAGAPAWAVAHAGKLLPCVPGSGESLARLLGQIGLRLV
jgi:2-polyprenyl-6-methoxyphenol hydroxylase-like FAD-dependent oxidoreductase